MKERNVINSLYKQDLFVGDKQHTLENYEDTVKGYLEWAKSTKDFRRIAEAILEYNEFLINYKVGLNEKNPDELLMKNKEICIKTIVRNFYEFDSIFERHKESKESSNSIKKIYDKVRSNRKNNFDLMEVPLEILMQKSNYLKGKFMKINLDYRSALEFFYNSQKINVVCDAKIVKQSINQIIGIYKIMIENINYDIDLIKNKNQVLITKNNNDDIGMEKVDKDIELDNRLNHRDKFQGHIDRWTQELQKYVYFQKDYSVLLNFSKSMLENQKKIDRAIKISDTIYENFITSEDRFSLFLVSKSANPIINLSYKNFQTYEFIKDSIAQVKRLVEDNGFKKENESELIKAIIKAREYLNKRSIDYYLNKLGYDKTEKWVLVVTDSIREADIDYLRKESIQEIFEPEGKNHIAIIGIGVDEEDKVLLSENLDYNKNCYVDYDHLEKLKHNLRIKGDIRESMDYSNEIYESNEQL